MSNAADLCTPITYAVSEWRNAYNTFPDVLRVSPTFLEGLTAVGRDRTWHRFRFVWNDDGSLRSFNDLQIRVDPTVENFAVQRGDGLPTVYRHVRVRLVRQSEADIVVRVPAHEDIDPYIVARQLQADDVVDRLDWQRLGVEPKEYDWAQGRSAELVLDAQGTLVAQVGEHGTRFPAPPYEPPEEAWFPWRDGLYAFDGNRVIRKDGPRPLDGSVWRTPPMLDLSMRVALDNWLEDLGPPLSLCRTVEDNDGAWHVYSTPETPGVWVKSSVGAVIPEGATVRKAKDGALYVLDGERVLLITVTFTEKTARALRS